MQQHLLAYLRTNYAFFTETEKKIAGMILKDPGEFLTYSLSELAEQSDVSQGSVVNFSKKFAGGGFPELKLRIAACVDHAPFFTPEERSAAGTVSGGIESNIELFLTAYRLSAAANSEEVLSRVVDRILHASRVEIYGVFRSAAVAMDLCYQMLEIGIPAAFVHDILTCSISASNLRRDALVIAISASGRTQDILDAVRYAKTNGVPVISLTSDVNSPLAKLSDDCVIASSSGVSLNGTGSEIRASMMMISNAICTELRSRSCDEKARMRNEKVKSILSSHNVREVEQ